MPTDRPRLLYISTFLPYPATFGGKLRVGNLIRGMSRTYDVHYLGLALSSEERSAEALAASRSGCASLTVVPHRLRRARAGLRAVLGLQPYELNLFNNPEFVRALARLTTELQPDVLWFSRLAAAQYLTVHNKGRALAVLDQHDLTSQLWRLMEESAGERWVRLFARLNRQLVQRVERRIYPRFDVAVSVSEHERQLTAALAPGPVLLTAGNGVDVAYFAPAEDAPAGRDLVLTGSMDQRRNIDAAVHFATTVFPPLRARFAGLRFVIVGREPARAVRELARQPGVVVTGSVPDVRPFLNQAAVFVAPYRFGSGVKHKLPIAMAMGKAIVSTSNAVQGLDLTPGEHLLLADTPAAFVDAVAALLDAPERRRALGAAARQRALERYAWDAITARLVEQIETLRDRR